MHLSGCGVSSKRENGTTSASSNVRGTGTCIDASAEVIALFTQMRELALTFWAQKRIRAIPFNLQSGVQNAPAKMAFVC